MKCKHTFRPAFTREADDKKHVTIVIICEKCGELRKYIELVN